MTGSARRASPPKLPKDLIVRLVEAYEHGSLSSLPLVRAEDALPLLDGSDREVAAASALITADRLYYPPDK